MNILVERLEIIFLHYVFRYYPLRDPNISVVTFFVEGVDEIKFEKSMQIKKALFVGMTLLRKSLDVVMSAVGV